MDFDNKNLIQKINRANGEIEYGIYFYHWTVTPRRGSIFQSQSCNELYHLMNSFTRTPDFTVANLNNPNGGNEHILLIDVKYLGGLGMEYLTDLLLTLTESTSNHLTYSVFNFTSRQFLWTYRME
mmetsp:Transcript_25874/g.22919  ORF Transcript_25874/g.22919 Transcript_25874/m.22919 type:complete len:125 (+) Transcript_25874:548-922(+)